MFCSSGVAKGVRLENLKYELNDHTMSADFPLGVSNEFVDAPAKITVGDGTLLALWREQGDFYRLLPKLWDREEAEYAGK